MREAARGGAVSDVELAAVCRSPGWPAGHGKGRSAGGCGVTPQASTDLATVQFSHGMLLPGSDVINLMPERLWTNGSARNGY
ncbi:hypothetical protein GCM10029963_10900 [Micromonospora andamanensis]|nr:hypothetical protein Vwe01_24920 [Micromonospora andamanensis]